VGRPSEIRAFLLRYAARRGILVKEYVPDPVPGEKNVFYCHLELPGDAPGRSATAVSHEHADNALTMAFLNLGDPSIDFLDETQ
jgi:hypothetical protein